jgi:putative flippase GtrA
MRLSTQFSKFVLAGGVAAAANFSSRFVFSQYLAYIPAIALAFFVGMATGFLLMKKYIFTESKHGAAKQICLYLLVNLAGLALTVVVSISVAELASNVVTTTGIDEAIGHFAGVVSPIFLSFYAHKKLTFA